MKRTFRALLFALQSAVFGLAVAFLLLVFAPDTVERLQAGYGRASAGPAAGGAARVLQRGGRARRPRGGQHLRQQDRHRAPDPADPEPLPPALLGDQHRPAAAAHRAEPRLRA
ncbi:MAG: hypothetical protein RML12_04940 [Xanthomonadales bacterium]|nr:hypothetical protein [Xanthomonadales bacterium]